jgi:nucleotide-binding universal stress UspA family protein
VISIQKILVPIDFSEHSQHAVRTAIGLAKTLGAEIHLAHVLHYPVQVAAPGQVAIPQDLWTEIRDAAARKLEKASQTVSGEGVSVETHLTEGANAHAIVDLAENISADLIVMGTRGLSGLKHVMLGSVAERTVRLAHCPVMTVKADE